MKKAMLIMLLISLLSCHNNYKINIKDTEDFKSTIIDTEMLIKKIEVLPKYKDIEHILPRFYFKNGGITMEYTSLNFNPIDSIRDGRYNPNEQEHIDTCHVIPGLTSNEWTILKKNLRKLENFGIEKNNIAFYNDGKFQFFYYLYYYCTFDSRGSGHLALLSDEIVKTEDFKSRFDLIKKKDGIYMITRK